jgi:hypothetical protein
MQRIKCGFVTCVTFILFVMAVQHHVAKVRIVLKNIFEIICAFGFCVLKVVLSVRADVREGGRGG